ncbi:hypothetical protein X798_02369, partial [Onchocerca flexuosa]
MNRDFVYDTNNFILAKGKILKLLDKVKEMDWKSIDQHNRRRTMITSDKMEKIELYVATLVNINDKWLNCLYKIPSKRGEGDRRLRSEVKKHSLVRYKKKAETTTGRIRNVQEALKSSRSKRNNPSGSPNSKFAIAAVRRQIVLEKMSYLLPCSEEEVSETVRCYDIAPEKYCIVRRILMEKFSNRSAITNSLYSEFQDIERNDRDWTKMTEAIERVLRQLETVRENLDHW